MVKQGVVPSQEIRDWIAGKRITAESEIHENQIQPASLDLRVGTKLWTLYGEFKPEQNIETHLKDKRLMREEKEIPDDGLILERNVVYLMELQEKINLDKTVHATMNPKSSTGRIDLSTKVVGDHYPVFDMLPLGYNGRLYCIATPLSFPVKIHPGDTLSQIKFIVGDSRLDDLGIRMLHERAPLAYSHEGVPIDVKKLHVRNSALYVGVDLEPRMRAYFSRRDPHGFIDLQKRDHNPNDFFTRIEREDNLLMISPGEFYLLATSPRIALPVLEETQEAWAATMVPIDANYGNLRTHYAGFVDPGWGSGRNQEKKGKSPTLEARSTENVPFITFHEQALCGFAIEKLRGLPDKVYGDKSDKLESNYFTERRGPQLSKHFSEYKEK